MAEEVKAISTFKTYLMHKTGTGSTDTFEKLIDIKDFPDLGKASETIDVTTLSDSMKTYIQDIPDTGSLEFTCNYTKTEYTKLKAMAGKTKTFAIWFGATETAGEFTPNGEHGKFQFDGQLAVTVKGAGVSNPVEMTVSIAPNTPIKAI